MKVELDFSADLTNVPANKVVIAWGAGGWRFMRRDEVGQWRNMYGNPKSAPRMWAPCPDEALKAIEVYK